MCQRGRPAGLQESKNQVSGSSTKGGGGSEVSKDLMNKRDVLLISSVRMQKKNSSCSLV